MVLGARAPCRRLDSDSKACGFTLGKPARHAVGPSVFGVEAMSSGAMLVPPSMAQGRRSVNKPCEPHATMAHQRLWPARRSSPNLVSPSAPAVPPMMRALCPPGRLAR
jgi:hypothetical protein